MTLVHVDWEGPWSLSQVKALASQAGDNAQSCGYGVYQVYGQHRLYGPNCLLYIGKAVKQCWDVRVRQEGWAMNCDPAQVQIYFGQLGMPRAQMPATHAAFAQLVDEVESLLIYAHGPACNSAKLHSLSAQVRPGLRVMNWGASRDLMPEVSRERWDQTHWQHPDYDWIERHVPPPGQRLDKSPV